VPLVDDRWIRSSRLAHIPRRPSARRACGQGKTPGENQPPLGPRIARRAGSLARDRRRHRLSRLLRWQPVRPQRHGRIPEMEIQGGRCFNLHPRSGCQNWPSHFWLQQQPSVRRPHPGWLPGLAACHRAPQARMSSFTATKSRLPPPWWAAARCSAITPANGCRCRSRAASRTGLPRAG